MISEYLTSRLYASFYVYLKTDKCWWTVVSIFIFEAELFARCSLLFNRCSLLVTFCSLFVTFWSLLVAFCSFARCLLWSKITLNCKKWFGYNETPPQIFPSQISEIFITFSGWWFSKFSQQAKPFSKLV